MTDTISSRLYILVACLTLAAGCGGTTRAVRFSYQEPPVCQIPASVGSVAVAEFRAAGGEGWGGEVSRRLAEALERAELPHRVQVLGAQAGTTQPAGIAPVVVDTPSAVAWGKAIGADAVAYGAIHVVWPGSQPSAKALGGAQVQGESCLVTVRMVIDEVRTGQTVASMSVSQRYPPQEGAPAAEAAAPAADALVEELIGRCVDELVARLCPETVWVNERLQFGRTRLVLDGNRLARGGKYASALDCYRQAIELSPGDDGAVFNAGLMCEALGRLEEAAEFYERAAVMRGDEHTDQALRRLDERRAGRR